MPVTLTSIYSPILEENIAIDLTGGTFTDADRYNAFQLALEDAMTVIGLGTDTASAEGTHEARLKYLEANAAVISRQIEAPESPVANQLWIDTDATPSRPLKIFTSGAFSLVGADAQSIMAKAIDPTDTPANGETLVYDSTLFSGAGGFKYGAAGTFSTPLTTAGDLYYRNGSNADARLAIGAAVGHVLMVQPGSPSLPGWQAAPWIPLPAGALQGSTLVYNGSAWTYAPPGDPGDVLTYDGTNTSFAPVPSSPPGGAIAAPSSPTNGALLQYESGSAAWELLTPGTSGLFLKSNGPGSLHTYAAPAGGSTIPFDDTGQLLSSGIGGALQVIEPGTNGYVLSMVAGYPAWVASSASPFALISGGNTFAADIELGTDDDYALIFLQNGAEAGRLANNGKFGLGAGFGATAPVGVLGLKGMLELRTDAGTTAPADTAYIFLDSADSVLKASVDGAAPVAIALGSGSGGHIIEKEDGTDMTARGHLQFADGTGATVAVTDDSGNDRTIVTISASGGTFSEYALVPFLGI